MNITVFEFEESERGAWDRLDSDHLVSCVSHPLNLSNAADFRDAEVISTFIDSKLDAETLKPLSQLRLIATRSTGYDHIDLEFCRSAGSPSVMCRTTATRPWPSTHLL